MTLDEWLRDERARLALFAQFWAVNQAADAERFPADMPAGEWDEQYRAWDPE